MLVEIVQTEVHFISTYVVVLNVSVFDKEANLLWLEFHSVSKDTLLLSERVVKSVGDCMRHAQIRDAWNLYMHL